MDTRDSMVAMAVCRRVCVCVFWIREFHGFCEVACGMWNAQHVCEWNDKKLLFLVHGVRYDCWRYHDPSFQLMYGIATSSMVLGGSVRIPWLALAKPFRLERNVAGGKDWIVFFFLQW